MPRYPRLTACLSPLAYLLAAGSLGSLLAIPLYLFLEGSLPLAKIVSKLTLLALLLGIYPTMKWLRLDAAAFGLCRDKKRLARQVAAAWIGGIASLAVVIAVLLNLEVRVPDPDAGTQATEILALALKAGLIGLLVACLEEPLFRGLLIGALRNRVGAVMTIMISAVFYAGLHFLKTDRQIAIETIDWYSGFILLGDAFSNALALSNLDSFLALFAVGVLLACIRLWIPASLGWCIGLHAGWIFTIKISKEFSDSNAASSWAFLVGHYDGIIGYLAAAWLLLLTFTLYGWRRRYSNPPLAEQV